MTSKISKTTESPHKSTTSLTALTKWGNLGNTYKSRLEMDGKPRGAKKTGKRRKG